MFIKIDFPYALLLPTIFCPYSCTSPINSSAWQIMSSCFTIFLSLSFSSFFFFVFVQNFSTEAAPTFVDLFCVRISFFTPNSTYESNLNTVLSSLSSNATTSTNGFATATAGQNPPDQAHGLFLCRGDVSISTCSDCVATGKLVVLRRCRNQRVATIWYDECMLRYDNRSFFSALEMKPSYQTANTSNITDPTRFAQVLGQTMDTIAKRASNGGSGKKFAVEEANLTSLQKLYTLAQCTPDLTTSDCNRCLQERLLNLPQDKQGGRSFTLICGVRFELFPFYNTSAMAPVPPPQLRRPPAPERPKGKSNKSTMITIAITIFVGGFMILLFLTCCLLRRKGKRMHEVFKVKGDANELTTVESLQFDLATIQAATNDFSLESKLGEGGFGEVFQGKLPNGQQIAVKRLSQSSRQGDEEFKNEVLLVAKLQHRNLVRLLGFCLEGDEKLLAYEFVPNKSLDYFLFDPQKSDQLNWPLRYKIVYGIARGMLYLHEESRLRIIHRDLKCSNILLDSEMNPKISDFGMARIFGVDQTQANTDKIVGTFGYMSPEYAMHGRFSVKSDVYSFGILLLEIICGKKNGFYHQFDEGEYLARYAWNQWRVGTPLKVLDPTIVDSNSRDQVLRCLHICLLCIQEDPAIRPTMATVVLMLSSNSITPPSPRHPAFFVRSKSRGLGIPMKGLESNQSTSRTKPLSNNNLSLTELYPR
ncbi:hypothetical protein ACJRO7_032631 [Eucalyptus globulus]|uniref:Cysteine-rich receptor-like protein kinase 10 n=1 Tax=Eucalyptus globulus TaxID=34317 RepID=A0ABD3JK95_EUCGL